LTAGIRVPNRIGGDSFSQHSKSMSKISDNASEGSYDQHSKAAKGDKFRHTKNGAITGDLKTELGRKTQTFHSDIEDGSPTTSVQQPPALPPIFKKQKNRQGGPAPQPQPPKMMHLTSSQFGGTTSHASNLTTFNATKKNFPQLNKLTTHKKSYISPYSIKSIPTKP